MLNKTININFNKIVGPIKAMHAIGQPPKNGIRTDHFHFLKEANMPYSRLHDVGGWWGQNMFVDIPNLFRDFDADENDPNSYDFTFTDILIKGLIENGCEPYFRLGVTIENFHYIKAYRIFPPKDFNKWARICEHVIRHYNEGWADGFHYNITYWEIWNEPDDCEDHQTSAMWRGTTEEYFDLYEITAKHLKKCFGDTIKVGGYASTGVNQSLFFAEGADIDDLNWTYDSGVILKTEEPTERAAQYRYRTIFFHDFIKRVVDRNIPFDFFSYHSYLTTKDTFTAQAYIEKELEAAGLGDVEIHLNEYNNYVEKWNAPAGQNSRGVSAASSNVTALMCGMQNTKMHIMCYYDAQIGTSFLGGLFNPLTCEPFCTYYAMKAFGELYSMGVQVDVSGTDDGNLYAVAATNSNGSENGVLITALEEDVCVDTNLTDDMTVYLINDENLMVKTDMKPNKLSLKKYDVLFIK